MPAESIKKEDKPVPAFLGLNSYTEAQANSFFGRDEEIDKLTALVQVNTLTIVFGKSGTGKTSLLNAGVFPKLRKHYCLPFRIRLAFNENSPDLVSQIKKVLKEEIDKYGFKVQSYPGTETLWEYFHKEPLWQVITPILVFDQFEEIFTLSRQNSRYALTELPAFWEELSDIIENNIPAKLSDAFLNKKPDFNFNYKSQKTKVVFAFREEYLPEFETITSKIPSLKYSRFRLMPMNGHQAYDVITKTWSENINPSESRRIISYLTNDPHQESYDLITIEPSLLSQVCTFIDEKRIQQGSNRISAQLLNENPKETILRTIYNEATDSANEALTVGTGSKEKIKRTLVKEFVEDKLINSEGFRTRYNLSGNDEMLKPGITLLTSKYLIREDNGTVELTHDVLTPIIKADREIRRKEIERIAYRKKVIKRALRWVVPLLLIAAGAFAYFTKKSIDAKASLDNFMFVMEYKKDSLEKEFLNKYKAGLKTNTGKGSTGSVTANSALVDSLNKQIAELIQDTIASHSRIAELGSEILKLNADKLRLKDSLSEKAEEIKILIRDTAIMKETIHIDRIIISNKTKEYDDLKKKFDDLQSAYDKLLIKYNDLLNKDKKERKDSADFIRNIQFPPSPCPLIETKNSLQLVIYYTKNQIYHPGVKPEKINIYLVPYTSDNMKTIKRAEAYDYYNFDESALISAKGSNKAQYCNGVYYFSNVVPGKYLVKVCVLYGAYKIVNITGANQRIVIDAVPPVR